MSEMLDRAFSPAMLGALPLKNRILKAATYEGKSPGGVPGDELARFHREIVAGPADRHQRSMKTAIAALAMTAGS